MRINRKCASYPCHERLEDCTFCFCPLYPCLDPMRGEYVFSKKQNTKVWSCRSCTWIHQKKVVDDIFKLIREKETVSNDIGCLRRTGVIVLAHGSRIDTTKETLHMVVKALKKNLKLKYITPAYLQLCQPGLSKVTELLVSKGCRKIIIVPCFLFNGNHVTRDIPLLLQKEKEKYPEVELVYAKALAEDEDRIGDIIKERIEDAIAR